jgi:hypothetical protein
MTTQNTIAPPSAQTVEAIQIARELMSALRKHDVGVIRLREIKSFVSPPVLDANRRAALFEQTCEVIMLTIPALISTLPSVYQFDAEEMLNLKTDIVQRIHGCMTGNKVPFNKVPNEREIADILKVQRFWPYRAQLVLSLREVANKGLTLAAELRLLKASTHKGQSVYRQIHDERQVIKGRLAEVAHA